MGHLQFLEEFVIILIAAVLIAAISRPFRLPSIIGFLITGILIGPAALNFVDDREMVDALAEVGVVMLLFVIGLEFSLAHLKSLWKQFFVAGSLQVIGTVLLLAGILSLTGILFSTSVFFGCLIALSSTAVVLKILSGRAEVETPQGKLVVGILLFQDMCIVPMIVFAPLLSDTPSVSWGTLFLRLGLSAAAAGGVFILSRLFMQRILDQIVRTRTREAFLMVSLLACLLLAYLSASLGFSYALGAFVAGLIISETQYHHEVVAEVVPFRDLFMSLFFISVGMLLDLSFVFAHPLEVFAVSSGVFVIKAVIVFLIASFLRFSPRTSIIASLSLAQVGEFSFVLAQVGTAHGLLVDPYNQYFLSASIITMMMTPGFIALGPSLAERTQRFIRYPWMKDETHFVPTPLSDHVIIGGFGINGQNVARVLHETGIPYILIETDADTVRGLQQQGRPAVFGDVTRREILATCGISRARVMVFAISDPAATRSGVQLARSMNPNVHIIVRTRHISEVDELMRLGAHEVIPEEFETSIEIFTRVLDHYHLPRNLIHAQIEVIRNENYSILRGLPQTARGLDRVASLLTAGTSDTFLVTPECRAAGKSLADLDIPGQTGASLIAVVRNEQPYMTPPPDFLVQPSDILVLVGNHANMDKAFVYLGQKEQKDPSRKGQS